MSRVWIAMAFVLANTVAQAEIRMNDDLGHELVLTKPAQRVISLAPHITEALFEVGAGDLIVGAVDYSDYPEAAKQIPRVGSNKDVSYETVVSLKPDLVLAWNSNGGDKIIRRLKALGIPVFVDDPKTLDDVGDILGQFGELTGRKTQGRVAQQRYRQRLGELRNANSNKPPLTVFYQVWHQPLMTLNGDTLISDIIEMCGGVNSFADAIPIVPRLNVESVITADPQVIVASGMGKARPEWLDDWLEWPIMQAVQNDQLYFVEPDILHRHSPRILLGAAQMCEHLDKARAALLTEAK
ncbi:cobalamin-binding protein [Porticoccus sp. W117]|uniref:cobalamin-binding protein n=1 Tax=Porticoccus sp. W117 TaxID=3054777 RepID=UPI002595FC7C|nr:cobalamin-binding protein [Porticoccus sp. W117]MDM3871410.1 cobalamin-binding protein [Porticoccus sp. W117]